MLTDMGIETGIDLDKLLAVVGEVSRTVNDPVTSHMSKAKIYPCMTGLQV